MKKPKSYTQLKHMNIINTSLQLIHYGHSYDEKVFNEVRNRWVKPYGGLWSSPVDSEWGWIDWGKSNEFGRFDISFKFSITGRVLVIDSMKDLRAVPKWEGYMEYVDFEALCSLCDAIWLTVKGENETRYIDGGLYGWDCESVLILNKEIITL